MESKELKDSIAEYELQLSRVEQTISACDDDEELTNLQSLRNDIKQLLNLTRENLSALQNRSTASTSVSSPDNSDPLADEYAMFMAEMAQSGAVEIKNADEDNKSELDVEDELKSMEGMKCQAPHKHNFGGTVYHNALIYNVISMESNQTFDEINVRVMFTNPTHQEMLPCPYYLETECKFSEDQCRYSHGEIVPLASLKEYKEPDFDLLKPGSRVIAKNHNKLWQRAVIKSLSDDHTCSIQFESNKQETKIDLSEVLPLQNDDEDNSSSSSDENSDSEETDSYKAALVQQSLFNTPTSQALGSWEKHTKGIGSKLMQQMGYVIGTGLGPKGDGRIEPVEAVILPTGKSLDHCMTLKENAGGDENLFKVERRMKNLQRKMEENSKKAYERDKQKTNVFEFLNDTLAVKVAPKTKDPCKPGFSRSKHRQELATETSRNLNITSLKIEEDIKKVERELWKINESLTRHSDENSIMNKTLKAKLISKQNELKNLKLCEKNVNNEQCLRKDKKKLTVF